ncbi:MAG TPA: S8 family serine peptidase [Chloroflexota bacterium]|nr:S8 family serine peptidase [Chloroflexota bacterium]
MLLKRACALLLALGLTLVTSMSSASAGAPIDARLTAVLASAAPSAQLVAIANFDPATTNSATLAGQIHSVGARTLTFKHLDSIGVYGTTAQILQVANLRGVSGLYANSRLTYFLHESVPAIHADQAWATGVTGRGIGVAILDSGVDATHPDLAFGSKTVQNVKVAFNPQDVFTLDNPPAGALFVENVPNTDTSSGHGTHVAGITAGNGSSSGGYYTGVAKDASVVGLGTGETLLIIWALAGFDYILDHQAQYNIKVVNNSWGTTADASAFDPNDPINRASLRAHDAGISVVFAAGNDGPGQDTMNTYAVAPWVIGVAAGCKPDPDPTNSKALCTSGGQLADFSSRGVPGSSTAHPTLTAPGANIVSTRATTGIALNALDSADDVLTCHIATGNLSRYTCASGTSMATPHVVGTVALMQQAANGALSPDQVKNILVSTARPMVKADGIPYGLWEAGAGYLDAFAAVQASTP